MKQEKYLSDDSDEARELREKVRTLFFSCEKTNHKLAYQLIKGGGMHRDFAPILWAIAVSRYSAQAERNKIGKLLKTVFSEEEIEVYNMTTNRFLEAYIYKYASWEDWADDCLQRVGETPSTADLQASLAWALMVFMRVGGRFALKWHILPTETVLDVLRDKEHNTLSLENFRLTALPAEIAMCMPLEELNLQGNVLCTIPAHLENLPLEEISLDDNVDMGTLERLARVFPLAMGRFYKSKGYQIAHQSQNKQRAGARPTAGKLGKQALELLERAPQDLRDDSYWFSVGLAAVNAGLYEKSIEANLEAIKRNPKYGDGVSFYNIACAYANTHEKEKMLEYLALAAQHSTYMDWYREAMEDNDFQLYWGDDDLLAGKK